MSMTRRREAAALLAIALLFFAARAPSLSVDLLPRGWSSDTAVFALMADDLLSGKRFDVYYWDQDYLGPLISFAIAGAGALLRSAGLAAGVGPLAARVAVVLLSFLALLAWHRALRRIVGPLASLFTTGWLAVGSPLLFRNTLFPWSVETMLLGSALLIELVDRELDQGRLLDEIPRLRLAYFGLVAGFFWWMNESVAFALAGCGVAFLLRSRSAIDLGRNFSPRGFWARVSPNLKRDLRVAFSIGPPLAAGFLVGYSPVLLGRWLGWFDDTYGYSLALLGTPGIVGRMKLLITGAGIEAIAGPTGPVTAAFTLLVVSMAVLSVWSARQNSSSSATSTRGLSAGRISGYTLLLTTLIFFLTNHRVDLGGPRYLLPSLPILFALAADGILSIRFRASETETTARRAFALIVFVAGIALFSRGAAREIESLRSSPDPRPLIAQIRASGYDVCFTDYYLAFRLELVAERSVRFVPNRGPRRNLGEAESLAERPGKKCVIADDLTFREATEPRDRFWRRPSDVVKMGRAPHDE